MRGVFINNNMQSKSGRIIGHLKKEQDEVALMISINVCLVEGTIQINVGKGYLLKHDSSALLIIS